MLLNGSVILVSLHKKERTIKHELADLIELQKRVEEGTSIKNRLL